MGQEGYLDVFHTELDAFKHRVREYAVRPKEDTPKAPEQPCTPASQLDPREVMESLPPVSVHVSHTYVYYPHL